MQVLQPHKYSEFFEAAFKSSPNALVISIVNDGTILDANDSFYLLFETSREEVIGRSSLLLNMFANPATRGFMVAEIRKSGMLSNYETIIKSKTGREKTVLISSERLMVDGNNTMLTTIQDITYRKETELSLQLEHSILEAVVSNIGVGFVVSDLQGNIISMNHSAALIHGYESEAEGLNHLDRYAREFVLTDIEGSIISIDSWPLALALKNDFRSNYKVRLVRLKDQCVRIISYNTVPVYDATNKPERIIITMTDLSDIEERTTLLARERELFESIFNTIPVMITIYDPQLRNFRFNKEHKQILGWIESDAEEGKLMEKVYPDPEYRKRVIDYMQSLESGWKEWQVTAKDGSKVDSLWANILLKSGMQLGIGIDIREQKRSREALQQSEEKFRSLFENIPEAVALHEVIYQGSRPVGYKLIETNAAYEKYAAAKGSALTEIGPQPGLYSEQYYQVAATGKPYRFETFIAGIQKHFIINIISPRQGFFATVFEDITDHKTTELEIKQKNEELTRFIYTVSHDLKSPLVTIKSFTDYLREDIELNDKAAQDKDIGFIQNAADKMGVLLDELLNLSRIGRKEDPKTEYLLHEIILSALDLVAGSITKRNVKVEITGPGVMLFGHYQRLIQLYQNLIDNAVKFMGDQEKPYVELGAKIEENRNEVILFIKDNGSGIDPRYRHKVFGLFEKLETGTEGSGIGLAMVKRIVEVHGGSIWFESEGKGKGTTFYFTLEKTRIID